jgi:hypothetical protein
MDLTAQQFSLWAALHKPLADQHSKAYIRQEGHTWPDSILPSVPYILQAAKPYLELVVLYIPLRRQNHT